VPVFKKNIAPYEWGKLINFSRTGDAPAFLGSGWGEPEEGRIWTDGLNASMNFRARPPAADVAMVLSCDAFLGEGHIPYQELTVFVNFLRVGFAVIDVPMELEFEIPRWVFKEQDFQVDFYLPKAASPAALGIGSDLRNLGIVVNRMMMIMV
jgi:hypothetical protein